MNVDICNKILKSKDKLVPAIFTQKQIELIEMYISKKILSNAQKTYLYSKINKKIVALGFMSYEFYINNTNIIEKRVEDAKKILIDVGKRAFVSGSFLYSELYGDIDIFVISNRRKQYRCGKKQYICITESDLKKPMFASAFECSVANFRKSSFEVERKISKLEDNLLAYQIAINDILDKNEPKTLRYLILEYNLIIKNKLLNSYELYNEYNTIKNEIVLVNNLIKKVLLNEYSNRYLYDVLVKFTKKLNKNIKKESANENLKIYYDVLNEIKNESRKSKV